MVPAGPSDPTANDVFSSRWARRSAVPLLPPSEVPLAVSPLDAGFSSVLSQLPAHESIHADLQRGVAKQTAGGVSRTWRSPT